jgi:cobalt/nickel transport system permease protein
MSGSHSHDSRSQAAPAGRSRIHALDARAKIVGFISFTIVVVTTPPRPGWPFVLYAVLLAFVAGLARLSPALLAKRALVVVPFVLMIAIFLPFFHRSGEVAFSLGPFQVTDDGLLVLWNAGAKALLGVTSMIILTVTTTFSELVEGFERLRAPKVLVLTVSFMHRYGYLFAEESRRMQRAMTSRNFRARWLANVPTLGHMLGALFLRSYARGERVYVAMVSRGYEGAISLAERKPFRRVDALFLTGVLAAVTAIRFGAWAWGL